MKINFLQKTQNFGVFIASVILVCFLRENSAISNNTFSKVFQIMCLTKMILNQYNSCAILSWFKDKVGVG